MATIKPSFSTEKIKEYFKKYRNIKFKTGTYNIAGIVTIYSGTTVNCEPGVIFKRTCRYQMFETEASETSLEYNAAHDITWNGGTFLASTREEDAIVIVIYHAKNITFNNITVDGCRGYHSIECNSSQNVRIENSTFKNQTSIEGAPYREAIQIDFAYQLGYPYRGTVNAPANDGTHCKDITIVNCTFENVPNGIGTHTVSKTADFHENITIENCTFKNVERYGIQLQGMKNVTIRNCPTAVIAVQKRNQAHKLNGDKVDLTKPRYNLNVTIDDNIIVN